MLLMVVMLSLAVLVLLLSPAVLRQGRWQVRFPRLALSLWFGAFVSGFLFLFASICAAVGISVGSQQNEAFAGSALAWLFLLGLGGLGSGVFAAAKPLAQSQSDAVDTMLPRVTSSESRGEFTLARFAESHPIACAVRCPEPAILLSSGMMSALTDVQLQAVLAHERAHLRGHHDWASRIARVNARCLPKWLPAGTAFQRATCLLIELIADDAAARQAGAVNLANALARLGDITTDPGLLVRAERLTLRRWKPARLCHVPEAIRL